MNNRTTTIRSIAQEAGVSKSTVSLALKNDSRIAKATREHVQEVASRLGYTANPIVSRLMSELQQGSDRYHRTIGLLNLARNREMLETGPNLKVWIEGAHSKAQSLGYKLDEFWVHPEAYSPGRLAKVMKARGIEGAVVVGVAYDNHLPPSFEPLINEFSLVTVGVRTQEPTLPYSCVDHHELVTKAVGKALELGYRRPALVLDERLEELFDHRYSAAMEHAQRSLLANQRIPEFNNVYESMENRSEFAKWISQYKPDVILTIYSCIKDWVQELGLQIPQDVGLIQLQVNEKSSDWAGMNQHNFNIAEAAVETLLSMVNKRQKGIPEIPISTVLSARWQDGWTVQQKENPSTLVSA